MQYCSDRNYGCRLMEVIWNGNRMLFIENEKIRVTIILDKGCDIIDFNYKEKDISFLWRTQNGLNSLKSNYKYYSDMFNQAYHGGWFEAFPNVGLKCSYKNIEFQPYDEVFYLPWEYRIITDTPEELEIECSVQTLKTPFKLTKGIKLQSQSSDLNITECVENCGQEEFPFQWGHHPLLGEPFLSGECIIDIEGADINTYFAFDNARVKQGTTGKWPIINGKNAKVDLRKFPGRNADINDLYWLTNLKSNWVSVFNQTKNLGIKFSWDKNTYNHCLLWINANGDKGYPHFGTAYTLCIMPSTSDIHTIEAETKAGMIQKLAPDERKTAWINASVFQK